MLGPVGRIAITLLDGQVLEGGDTGWLDVTKLARQDDPSVELSLIRRMHHSVQYTQRGGKPLVAGEFLENDSLQRRVFGETSVNAWDALPAFVTQLEGFRPPQQEVQACSLGDRDFLS